MNDLPFPESLAAEPFGQRQKSLLEKANAIAHNMMWSWRQDWWPLFAGLDPETWQASHSPLAVVKAQPPEVVQAYFSQPDNNRLLDQAYEAYCLELSRGHQEKARNNEPAQPAIAYFCMEYGLHEAFANYSGGLGILAGDHIKSASQLGLDMTFVGLFYHYGYFEQRINADGQQEDHYPLIDREQTALKPACDASGQAIVVSILLGQDQLKAYLWQLNVGSVQLYLLDSDHPDNPESLRSLTDRLYGGDRLTRLNQEILLGVGGVKALRALGKSIDLFHMNEGHAAFLQLERLREYIDQGESFAAAVHTCSVSTVFTTHTPVPAGNESFDQDLLAAQLKPYCQQSQIPWQEFLELGQGSKSQRPNEFGMTVFSLRLSQFHNGVSELHGQVSQAMWGDLWRGVPPQENSISYITNGVHEPTWMAPAFQAMLSHQIGAEWSTDLDQPKLRTKLDSLPMTQVRTAKRALKERMVSVIKQHLADAIPRDQIDLSADHLIIAFARRFATYKRATLMFRDLERLAAILTNRNQPVRFVFAGKAHPADIDGQGFIAEIARMAQMPAFVGKIILLQNYDIGVARALVQGADLWLNNPRRPLEASGTSGQKVVLNFGLNFSVLDGWWREAYDGGNGWAIGQEKDYSSEDHQDRDDAEDFYQVLQREIAPLYFDQPDQWWQRAKASFTSMIYCYSSHRMVRDYCHRLYHSCNQLARNHSLLSSKDRNFLALERQRILDHWHQLKYGSVYIDHQSSPSQTPPSHCRQGASKAQGLDNEAHGFGPANFGKTLEVREGSVEVDLYPGAIEEQFIQLEVVVTDQISGRQSIVPMQKIFQDQSGVSKYHARIQSSSNPQPEAAQQIRIRAWPRLPGAAYPSTYGHYTWY